jgi:hypothetical protein
VKCATDWTHHVSVQASLVGTLTGQTATSVWRVPPLSG